jgi:ribonucleoside-triphosphate reductase (thioredoxin)
MKMNKEALSAVAFAAQYSHVTGEGRETPAEAMTRVKEMHLSFFDEEVHGHINEAFEEVFKGRVYPSQRSTQFGGKAILNRNWRIYNCTASYCDRPRFFAEYLWLLLCGCGCGVSVQKTHVKNLPELISKEQLLLRESRVHLIEDSIEGWSEAVHELILSYIPNFKQDAAYEVNFDYDLIRPQGSPISSGGLAPGPKPLQDAIEKIRDLLKDLVMSDVYCLSPIHCFDICAALSEAVLSGGVRRSASIMLFDFDDEDMKKAKVGDWWRDHKNRETANISAVMIGDKSEEEIAAMLRFTRDWGEPAMFWVENEEIVTNPCAEIGLFPRLMMSETGNAMDYVLPHQMTRSTGVSGWQACNLTEINLAKCKDVGDFIFACRAAAIIGTLQSMYTEEGYLLSASKKIVERERLLGISLTGIYTNPSLGLDPDVLEHGVRVIRQTNIEIAKLLKIDFASRLTCIKPSGNTSTVAGCSAGAHPWHAKKYLRRIRLSLMNPVYQWLKEKVPAAVQEISEDTGVITFAVEAPEGSIVRDQLNALDHLDDIALLQRHWVGVGSSDAYNKTPAVSHSVSCTVTVKPDEWDNIPSWFYSHMKENEGAQKIRGVSFLSYFGDHLYDNAPYQTVNENNLELWEAIAKLEFSEEELFKVVGASPDLAQDPACSGGACLLK